MKSLDEKEWGQFRIGDLYSVKRPAARNKDDYESGRVPFIASGAVNNGVMKCCTPQNNEHLDQKNCITVSPVDGSSFYQEFDFLGRGGAGSSILMLYSDDNEKLSGQFIARMIANTCSKYTYGHMGNIDSIKREFILLPVTDDGKPDYEYMAEYVRQQQDRLLNRYREYVYEELQELDDLVEIPALKEKEWKAFRIGDLFSVSRPKARNKDDYEIGNVPFVASGAENNGVMKLCEPKAGEHLDKKDCITVSPVDGSSFYQEFDFLGRGGAGSSILMLYSDNNEKFSGQFIARMIKNTCSKYTYGHMGNKESIKRETVLLPVSDNNEPDYKYMEQYVKNIMIKKYRQYLDYTEKR